MSDLADQNCVPCRGGVPPLAGEELAKLSHEVPQWKVVDGHHITRTFTFPDFVQALAFVNKVGALAEEQGHHPGHSSLVGQSRSHHLDPQNQRPHRQRFHPRREDRSPLARPVFLHAGRR